MTLLTWKRINEIAFVSIEVYQKMKGGDGSLMQNFMGNFSERNVF